VYCGGIDAARKLGSTSTVVSSHLNGRTSFVKGHLLRFTNAARGSMSGHETNKKKKKSVWQSTNGLSSDYSGLNCRGGTAELLLEGGCPGARGGHSLTRFGKSLFLFGGLGRQNLGAVSGSAGSTSNSSGPLTYLNDVYELELLPNLVDGRDDNHDDGGNGSAGGVDFPPSPYVPPPPPSSQRGRWWKLACRGEPPSKRAEHGAVSVGPYLVVSGGTTARALLPVASPLFLLHTPTRTWSIANTAATTPPLTPMFVRPATGSRRGSAEDDVLRTGHLFDTNAPFLLGNGGSGSDGGGGGGDNRSGNSLSSLAVENSEDHSKAASVSTASLSSEPSARMRPCMTLRPTSFSPLFTAATTPNQYLGGKPTSNLRCFPNLLIFGGGPWQCLEATHTASNQDGDAFSVTLGGF